MGNSSILIGIAGGTGSGKTSIANYLLKQFGNDELIVIEQDSCLLYTSDAADE